VCYIINKKEDNAQEVLLEYYRQTMENCRSVGDQKFKMLISIVISLGGILYAIISINEINTSYSLNKIIIPIIILLSLFIFLSLWTLLFLTGHLPIINNLVIKIEELQKDILFKKMDIMHLFCWDEISGKEGKDNEKLKKILIKHYNLSWVKKAKIEKNSNNRIIRIFIKNKLLTFKLNFEMTTAILEINNVKIDDFIVKMENDKVNVYESELKNRFREIYPQLNAYYPSKKLEKIVSIIIISLIMMVIMIHFWGPSILSSLTQLIKFLMNYFIN